jgi:hypothetical protein
MDVAAGGQDVVVMRWGKPYVRVAAALAGEEVRRPDLRVVGD